MILEHIKCNFNFITLETEYNIVTKMEIVLLK